MASVTAPMAGTVLAVLVSPGVQVQAGQDVIILESMKMEVPLQTDTEGYVQTVHVQPGEFVNEGDTLVTLTVETV